jgi:hypothetical protein
MQKIRNRREMLPAQFKNRWAVVGEKEQIELGAELPPESAEFGGEIGLNICR